MLLIYCHLCQCCSSCPCLLNVSNYVIFFLKTQFVHKLAQTFSRSLLRIGSSLILPLNPSADFFLEEKWPLPPCWRKNTFYIGVKGVSNRFSQTAGHHFQEHSIKIIHPSWFVYSHVFILNNCLALVLYLFNVNFKQEISFVNCLIQKVLTEPLDSH